MDSGSLSDVGAELVQDDAASVSSSSSSSDFAANDDERQDEVGLLSPGTSNANLAVPGLIVTSGGGGESGPASSSSSRSRSRIGSSTRSRAPSSLQSRSSVPAVRSRVSSLGVAVRSQAQTLLKCAMSLVVAGGTPRSSMARLDEEVFSSHPVVPELPSSVVVGRSGSGSMRDDSVAAAASLTTTRTMTRRESSHSGVFLFLIFDSRSWEEQEGVEANHNHNMTVSSSLPVAVTSASVPASHFRRKDNSGPDAVDAAVPFVVLGPRISSGDDATRTCTGVGMENSVGATGAMSEAVKHDDDDGGSGGDGQNQGVGTEIPWDRSRLHEQYGMPGASASASASGMQVE